MMAVCLLAWMMGMPGWVVCLIEVILVVVLVLVLGFFRDPCREVPAEKNVFLSPADGKISDIETIGEDKFIGGAAVRIGIFLNIFNVHINRSPCNVKIERIYYKQGSYKNAASPKAGKVNESNSLELTRTDDPKDRLIVRQISGAIARRIVCAAREGQELAGGEKFGMIKFGSRTELYMPAREDLELLVKEGDKVKAGVSVLAAYKS